MISNAITIMDSVNTYEQYIDKAKELGMKYIAFSEHGCIMNWVKKKQYCEKNGLKYIHGVEMYVTFSLEEKEYDNYHVGLYARNLEGVKELNKLVSKANIRTDGHFYYAPRISFDELINTSNDIIITTACLGGILSKGADKPIADKFISFLADNNDRCFLEIQHHNADAQVEYNQYLYGLSQKYNIPLIAGTDTHALNDEYQKARLVLQKAKDIHFANEDAWDITMKSYDELVQAYEIQNALPREVYLEAIENTNKFADMIEEFKLDTNNKYPRLYENSEQIFQESITKGLRERNILKKPNALKYMDRVKMEYEVYKSTDTIDYMLFQKLLIDVAHSKGMWQGYGRGSVNGSLIAYLLGITDMDSVRFNLNFFRFLNPNRISLADIDVDWAEKDREAMKEWLFTEATKMGLYIADIITFNTIAKKGAIKDVVRAFNKDLPEGSKIDADAITKEIDTKEEEFRAKYPEIFKYVDMLEGTIVSIGTHPSGTVVSPIPLDENVGLCTLTTTEYPVTILNMKELDGLNYVKLDILGLDNIDIINRTCKLADIPRLTPDNLDIEDWNVWKSIREDTTAIFQWESESAQAYIKRLFSDETIAKIKEINDKITYLNLFSFGNGAIRPAGNSFRYDAMKGIFKDNGMVEINDFLSMTMGYCLYQEEIMRFLNLFCGYNEAESDTVRRAIAKKYGTEKLLPEIKSRFISYSTNHYGISVEKAEQIIEPFIQIILDASDYGFSQNHSDPYSLIGYACGYLRYYYPLEFLTSACNVYKGVTEKIARVSQYANKIGVLIKPIKFRYSKGEYFCDKKDNCIYKGTESVKKLNINIGNELYELGKNQYEDFVDLLVDITEKTSCNKGQMEVLILLDYFEEFGSSKKLLSIFQMFDKRYSKKHTDKTKVKRIQEIKIHQQNLSNDKFTPDEKIKVELEYLGYAETTVSNMPPTYCIVTDIMAKYKNPVITLYRLCDGKVSTAKIKGGLFAENKFGIGDVINIVQVKEDFKWKKTENGFVRLDEKELYLTLWNIVK
jgi:DNA polymerase-3 subunit alpha